MIPIEPMPATIDPNRARPDLIDETEDDMHDHLLDNLGGAKWPITLCSAEGALLWDVAGKTYWDFYGGHAVTLIGQGDPRFVEAIRQQAASLQFMTTAADVPVRTKAARRLCRFTKMDKVFFVNAGSEANEAALKIARKITGRPVMIAFEQGFHGRTAGSLGVTWGYRDQHAPAHGDVRFVPFGDVGALKSALGPDVAGVIVEPVQGMAGVITPPDGYLVELAALTRANGSVVICDEVQSGIGRMGTPLACHQYGITPDMATVGKGLGGGFPVAALLLSREMAASVKPGEHGTTFGGAPMACAAVEATLRIIEEDGLLDKGVALGDVMRQLLDVPGVVAVRGSGAWVGLQLDRPARPLVEGLMRAGFLVGGAKDPCTLRLAPAAVMPHHAVILLADALRALLAVPMQGVA